MSSSSPAPQRLTLVQWLVCAMAAIGFAFDIYVLLILPLILPPALQELLPGVVPGDPDFRMWRGLMFWVPAMAGGIFGLLGGYLTDLLGRRRILTWSILLYAFSTFASGYSTSMLMLLVFRCMTFIGVCVEFVAAVAWVAELFPNHDQREKALGYTQFFSSIGGLLIGGVFLLLDEWRMSLPAIVLPEFLSVRLGPIMGDHATWRYTLLSGLIPAIPLIVIRPFLPESPVWRQKKEAGTLKRPSFLELFQPALRRTTLVTTVMVACSYGAVFGAIQQLPQIVPALPEVRAEVIASKAAAKDELETLGPDERSKREKGLARPILDRTAGKLTLTQESGGLVGRFLLALLVVKIVSRRALFRVFVLPGLVLMPIVFAYIATHNQVLFQAGTWNITLLHGGIFLAGLCTVAQFSFWGNYLPMAYPLHLRGTGESVAANIGGRMLGTAFAALTSWLSGMPFVPGSDDATRMAYTAAAVGFGAYAVNTIACFWLPEPPREEFSE
ncbi:MAG TPA: MFS transporter [Pirellulales bacterium]|nr:MFS transporter [Pirellulales bacterium]